LRHSLNVRILDGSVDAIGEAASTKWADYPDIDAADREAAAGM